MCVWGGGGGGGGGEFPQSCHEGPGLGAMGRHPCTAPHLPA